MEFAVHIIHEALSEHLFHSYLEKLYWRHIVLDFIGPEISRVGDCYWHVAVAICWKELASHWLLVPVSTGVYQLTLVANRKGFFFPAVINLLNLCLLVRTSWFQVRHNKAISRDTWAQLLEFVKVTSPSLNPRNTITCEMDIHHIWRPCHTVVESACRVMHFCSYIVASDNRSSANKLWRRRCLALPNRWICGLLEREWACPA
jgi:hypothetical protein